MNDMIQNLQAAGLNPIIIDENTDMDTPAATPAQSPIDRFMLGAKALQKAFTRTGAADDQLLDQRVQIQQLREDVTTALNGKGDFDAASKAFKAANNKLDKMIDARDATLRDAKAGITALRGALDDLYAELLDLED